VPLHLQQVRGELNLTTEIYADLFIYFKIKQFMPLKVVLNSK